MPKVEGLQNLVAALRKEASKKSGGTNGTIIVGFTAAYALAIHEREKGAPNPPRTDAQRRAMFASIKEREDRGVVSWDQGEPKFLERPARELTNDGTLAGIVRQAVESGKTVLQGLLLAGLRLQREAQNNVPLDTSNLKNSAFTRRET